MNAVDSLGPNQERRIGYKHSRNRVSQCLASIRNLVIAEVLRDYVASNHQREQICLFLSSWLGISK